MKRIFITALLLACGTVYARGPSLRIQSAGPGLDLSVPVRVVVTPADGEGRLAPRVEASDFTATLDGRPAAIQSVGRSVAPGSGVAIALLMDTSGSMRGKKIIAARSAAIAFVRRMAPNDRAALITFDTQPALRHAFTTDKTKVAAAMSAVEAGHENTALYDALDMAARMRWGVPPTRRAIVLLSDGHDTASHLTADDVAWASQRFAIPIYAIGLGPNADAATLDRLAAVSEGAYFNASTGDLAGLYADIWRRIEDGYTLDLAAPIPEGGFHAVRVVWLGASSQGVSAESSVSPPAGGWETRRTVAARAARQMLASACLAGLVILVALLAITRRPKRPEGQGVEPGRLLVTEGPMKGRAFRLSAVETIIGRASDADVRLTGDEEVSRRHARLLTTNDGYVLTDLESKNGVLLNGRKVERATVHNGDQISLGLTQLVLSSAGASAPAARKGDAHDASQK